MAPMLRLASGFFCVGLLAGCGDSTKLQEDAGPVQEDASLPPFGESRVLEVTFAGNGLKTVELDGYGAALRVQWVAAGLSLLEKNPMLSPDTPAWYQEHGAPVAYVGGTKPVVKVTLEVPKDATGPLLVRGEGELGSGNAGIPLVFEGQGEPLDGLLTVELSATAPLPQRVEGGTLTIRWSVVPVSGGFAPAEAGTSSHPFFVLRAAPVGSVPLLHTPLALVADTARGLADEQAVIDAVWARFATREIRRARDGVPLQYYGRHHDAPGDLRPLLVAAAGQCTTWAYLMHVALGAHGIESQVTGVFPSAGVGRLFVGKWRTLSGTRFVTTGADGICDSTAVGDDEQAIAVGKGRPYTKVLAAETPHLGEPEGDDETLLRMGSPSDDQGMVEYPMTGPNGIVDTPAEAWGSHYMPTLPLGFGLAQQRAYLVVGAPEEVVLGGDDVVVQQLSNYYVLTGRNGILETEPQPAVRDTGPGVSHIDVGKGSTAITFLTAIPVHVLPEALVVAGDDAMQDGFWVDSGPDGIAQTEAVPGSRQVLQLGTGKPNVPCVGPGPDGVLDTTPQNDDGIVSVEDILLHAPEGYVYVNGVNLWPLEPTPGQSATAPPPDYPNHVILRVGEKFYDPSYGTGPFDSEEAWEAASLTASGAIVKDQAGNVLGIAARTTPRLTRFVAMLPPN